MSFSASRTDMADSDNLDPLAPRRKPSSSLVSDICLPVEPVDVVSFAFGHLDRIDPTLPIYVDANNPNDYISAGEARVKVLQIARGLQTYGLKKGQCVCIHSYNNIWYPLLWLGIIAAGGIATGSNPAYTSPELVHHFNSTETRFVIAHVDCLSAVSEAIKECEISDSNVFVLGAKAFTVVVDDPLSEFRSSESLLECGYDEWKQTICSEQDQQDTVASYAATSGTTGRPKAAELSHGCWVAQGTNLEYVYLQRKHAVRQLLCLPIFHAFAAQLAIVLPLRLGITTYFMPRFALGPYQKFCHQFQITDTAVVPPIIGALLANGVAESLRSLRYIVCAGAPIRHTVQSRLYSLLHPAATVSQCWGATETGWICSFEQTECDQSGSVGRLLPNTSLNIIDDDGKLVREDHVQGEACIKSRSVMIGYHKNAPASKNVLDRLGFCLTGDRVYMDQGKIFIVGRMKDIMKVNGWQVSPEELELVIMQLDGISDCAVVAHTVMSNMGIEEIHPRAFVVQNPASKNIVTGAQIKKHVSQNLVSYKKLSGGVFFINKIPRTITGKILRRELIALDVAVEEEDKGDPQPAVIGERSLRKALWRYYVEAVVLVPLCVLLGPPGFAFLLLIFQKPTNMQRRIRQD